MSIHWEHLTTESGANIFHVTKDITKDNKSGK